MRRYLFYFHSRLRVAKRFEDGVYDVEPLHNRTAARAFLGRFANRPEQMAVLRALLAEFDAEKRTGRSGKSTDTGKMTVDEVLAKVAEQVVAGNVVVAEEYERANAPTSMDDAVAQAAATAATQPPPQKKKQTYIEVQVVQDATGQPRSPVRMAIKTPDGNEAYYTTDANGLIRIDDIDEGTCDARCDLKDLRLPETLAFVRLGEEAVDKSPTGKKPTDTKTLRVALVEAHQVRTGESIAGIAEDAEMDWKDLAKFNWGTDVPEEINDHLRDEVGCTKKTADGKNYVFDDTDNPGIVFIPTAWSAEGLATGQRHVVRVRTVKLPQTAWLAVQIYFHRMPIADLAVEFFMADADDNAGAKVGETLQTDHNGIARHEGKVAIGHYVCRIENQPDALVTSVSEEKAAMALVLPIGRPYFEHDVDKDQGLRQTEVGRPDAPEA